MSFLTDLKDKLAAAGLAIETEVETLAALIWGAAVKAENVAEADLLAAIPGAAATLKDLASQVVQSIEADPAFKTAVGDWKFGSAASRVWQLLVAEFPAAETIGAALLKGAVETAVQAAWAVLAASL